jgi:hypothetical protein
MNAEAKAWNKWLISEEGKMCNSTLTLQAPMSMDQYLQNRLWRAFTAGIGAAERIARQGKKKIKA